MVGLNLSSSLGLSNTILLDELFDFRLAELIKPGFCKRLDSCESLLRVEHEHALEALDGLRCHFAHVTAFERLWLRLGGELQADKTRVLIE